MVLSYEGGLRYLCRCVCGTEKIVPAKNLKTGTAISCGCFRAELLKGNQHGLKHGHGSRKDGRAKSVMMATYTSMKQRCCNPRCKGFPFYGGRGITVCQRWLDSFENFLADMGERPPGMELDRIDNNGNYEPDNCRWATRQQQLANRRRPVDSIVLTFCGESKTLAEWSRDEQTVAKGLTYTTLQSRFHMGWSHGRILTEPPGPQGKYK